MNVPPFLSTITFFLLFMLMLLYWSQAAFFGQERYKGINNSVLLLAIVSLTVLLAIRWIESGHFPSSNLYESLLFLSWSFLSVLFLFGSKPGNLGSFLSFSGREPLRVVRWFDLQNRSKGTSLPHRFGDPIEQLRVPETVCARATSDSIVLESSNLTLGIVLSPLSLLTFGFAFLSLPKEMQQSTALVPALQSNWLMMHVTVMILSYAALLSGSILSIAFLILTRLDAQKKWGLSLSTPSLQNKVLVSYKRDKLSDDSKVERLQPSISCIENQSSALPMPCPSGQEDWQSTALTTQHAQQNDSERYLGSFFNKEAIDTTAPLSQTEEGQSKTNKNTLLYRNVTNRLDNYSYRILALGFPLLTIGILSGAVWANEAWGSYWSWDPKETWALITWLVFAIYLHTRITKGWSGEKPAIVASLGFLLVWFCYLGVNLLGTGLHSYGWFSNS